MSDITRVEYIKRTDALLLLCKVIQLHTVALERNTEAVNRSTNFL